MSKKVIQPIDVLVAGDMSGTLHGLASHMPFMDDVGYQYVWTGSPVGTMNVQVSMDGINWSNVSPTGIDITTATSPYFIDVNLTAAYMVRPSFDAGGGSSGSLSIKAALKEV